LFEKEAKEVSALEIQSRGFLPLLLCKFLLIRSLYFSARAMEGGNKKKEGKRKEIERNNN